MNNYIFSLKRIKLPDKCLVSQSKKEFFRSNRNIPVGRDAAKYHLPFVGLEDSAFAGKLLKQTCAVSFTVSIEIFPVNEDAAGDYNYNKQPF
jgi:hypothetical protein